MPLRSRLFSGCKALEACLVSDAAHVAPGARGDHVARIQSALVRLRVLEVRDVVGGVGHYGPRTAAAVLAYKQTFGIINRKYQTKADNIVGRMTIASLDHAIWVLDGGAGAPRIPSWLGPHPQPPKPLAGPAGPAPVARTPPIPPLPRGGEGGGAGDEPFLPPLSDLPPDMQATIRRSNNEKRPDELVLFPWVAKHERPLSARELSARFADPAHTRVKEILLDLHTRMKPFNIWKNIRIIESAYQGTGSWGIFCRPFDHDRFLAQMIALTEAPEAPWNPYLNQMRIPIQDSKFCRDMFNVHGPRGSFREMVKQGPGLHICITQRAHRATEPCDLHIDQVQQGQVCSKGSCIPIVNGQTIEHLYTVGPWLASRPKEWLGL